MKSSTAFEKRKWNWARYESTGDIPNRFTDITFGMRGKKVGRFKTKNYGKPFAEVVEDEEASEETPIREVKP